MSEALASLKKKGGGGLGTIKDIIRDKVLNGGYTSICTLTVFPGRATINEGGVVADTTNHRVYVYVDFTADANFGSSSDYANVLTLTGISTNYYPIYGATLTSRKNTLPLITDEDSSNPLRQFAFGYNDDSYPNRILLAYGSGTNAVTTGQRYILYTAYNYK